MSMLVRKGTMLHRKNSAPSRRSTGRRSSRGSISSNRINGENNSPGSPKAGPHVEPGNEHELNQCCSLGRKSLADLSSTLEIEQRKGEFNHHRKSDGFVNLTSRTDIEYKLSPNLIPGTESYELRRPSSCASQISGEDRRELYRYSKLNYDSQDYGSIISQIREANLEATTGCDFTLKFYGILCNSAFATAFFALLLLLTLSMSFLGIKNLQECPVQPHLPVYFFVCGISGLIRVIWALYNQMKTRKHEHFEASFFEEDALLGSTPLKVMEWGLNIFILIWLILCTWWTMKMYGPKGPPLFMPTLEEPNSWCSKQLYLFSIAHLYFIYGLFIIFLFLWLISFSTVFIRNYMTK